MSEPFFDTRPMEPFEMADHNPDADELATLRTRLAEVEAENGRLRLEKRPVAWRCKGYGDGWIIFQDEQRALEYQEKTGCLMQGLYARAALAQTKEPSDDDDT